jgi:hypothetical protein
MSRRGRRRSVERRLRRHQTVSIAEIVAAFCVLERTPTGMVPAEGSIEAVRSKVAEAASNSLVSERTPSGAASLAHPSPRARNGPPSSRPATARYVVAIAEDADVLRRLTDVTIIRRVRGAVLAFVPVETAHGLRQGRSNLHVYEELAPAVAAFRLFDTS